MFQEVIGEPRSCVMNLVDLKSSLANIKEIIYFDKEEFLREKTSDPLKLQNLMMMAETLLMKNNNEEDQYFLYGTLGNLCRINGHPKKALNYLTKCLSIAQKERNPRKEIVSLIRYGEALKYDNQHISVLKTFDEAWNKCVYHQDGIYEDFILQHKGKCLMEMGRLEEAENCFLKSLTLRKRKNDSELILSTEKALELIKWLKYK